MRHIFCSLLFLTSSLLGMGQENTAVTVSGELKDGSTSKVQLTHHLTNRKVAESEIDFEKKFRMDIEVNSTDFYRLGINDKDFFFLVIEPGQNIYVKLDVNDLYASEVFGSPQSEYIVETSKKLRDYDKRVEEFNQRMQEEKIEFLKQSLRENNEKLATLVFLEGTFELEKEMSLYQDVVDGLSKAYPDNRFVTDLSGRVSRETNLAVGSEAPEIELMNPDSNLVKLSSLRGKVVLIDFWASWCGPCRRENPQVVSVYNKYKDKGFEIFGVSLDKSYYSWTKAIEDDNLTWTHVSDLKHWRSSVVPLYGFSGIPYTVLIDREGKIIAKGIRSHQLDEILSEMLGG